VTRSGHGSGGSSDPEESLSDRLPRAPGDRVLLGLLIVLIVGVPTIFLRTTFTTFDVPQLTLLWVLAVAVGLVGVYRVVVSGVIERGPRVLTVASAAFLTALVLTSVLSDQPWVAFTGLTVRGAGGDHLRAVPRADACRLPTRSSAVTPASGAGLRWCTRARGALCVSSGLRV
jgi:hypothetical protein